MNDRYDTLLAEGRRKITLQTGEQVYLVVIEEYACCPATVGDKKQQAEFVPSSLHTSTRALRFPSALSGLNAIAHTMVSWLR